MKNTFLALLFVIAVVQCFAQTGSYQSYYKLAREAYQAGNHAAFYENMLKAHELHPYHQGLLYQTGIAAALNQNPEQAIDFLLRAIQIKADFDLSHPDLASLQGDPSFEKLKLEQTKLLEPVIHSDTAFLVNDRSLHVESIAAGESNQVFYLASIHKQKIVRIDGRGNMSDFTTSGQDGLTSVFGIKIDPSRKTLWACSSPTREMEHPDSSAFSAVFQYDLRSRKLMRKFESDEYRNSQFGDLTLSPSGDVFISDGENNVIFKVNESTGRLEPFFTSTEFWNIQGISFDNSGKYLYIADYVRGIFRLDTEIKSLKHLPQQFPLSTKAIDGLIFYDNCLIAIQNLVHPMRVTQYTLDARGENLIGYKVIDRGHPAYNEPTTGCLVGDTLFYIANSLWSGYDPQRKLKPLEELEDVVILKTNLKKL